MSWVVDDYGVGVNLVLIFEVLFELVLDDVVIVVDVGNNIYLFGCYFESKG